MRLRELMEWSGHSCLHQMAYIGCCDFSLPTACARGWRWKAKLLSDATWKKYR
ncbi:hypothetical protein [Enterobacter bugandensis]|uniref:hypothetical protein n=1 Tax=Enterobacter bugandensis TaxID=881260 RepID=UPI00200391F8|nr:hypothetical protein [Enterobacter bugandensis]MCK6964539.1 hypothetical protein [Enterobacter bugandensis]